VNETKTVLMADSMNQNIQAPRFGILLDFGDYPLNSKKTFDCRFSFTIPEGSTLYMQNKGSGGADIENWQGEDHFSKSGSHDISFTMKRTSGEVADPLFIYAVNVAETDRNNVYKPFELTIVAIAK
jgi:hypothetical protein